MIQERKPPVFFFQASLMKKAAAEKFLVAGMHLPFPEIGHIRNDGKGRYAWIPITFGPASAMASPKSH